MFKLVIGTSCCWPNHYFSFRVSLVASQKSEGLTTKGSVQQEVHDRVGRASQSSKKEKDVLHLKRRRTGDVVCITKKRKPVKGRHLNVEVEWMTAAVVRAGVVQQVRLMTSQRDEDGFVNMKWQKTNWKNNLQKVCSKQIITQHILMKNNYSTYFDASLIYIKIYIIYSVQKS